MVSDIYQILVKSTFAGDIAAFVVFFDDLVYLRQLLVTFVRCGNIRGVDKYHLSAAGFCNAFQLVGNHRIRNTRPYEAVVGDHVGYAGCFFYLVFHLDKIGGVEAVVNDDEMGGRHVELLLHLVKR